LSAGAAAGTFLPARALRSAHVQTMLGSRGRGRWVRARSLELRERAVQEILTLGDGVRLEAWLSQQPRPAPAVILIHGWLGHADSSYVLSSAAELWNAGFDVFRLNLRDHGDTAHLNAEMFHSARLAEVLEAVDALVKTRARGPVGLAGYSLGGNFALRLARELSIETVAVCPAIDPPATMHRIDHGLAAYRLFFLRKWQRALTAKEQAFPERYRFDAARRLGSVAALTELFVREHTEYASTEEYLAAYALTGDALAGTRATVVYTLDDPVIPADAFADLPASLERVACRHGGHCAFIEHLARATWVDRFLATHFRERLAG
jgi:predicted alpha/beta-fold hydrolase